jgi:hypothetical protein
MMASIKMYKHNSDEVRDYRATTSCFYVVIDYYRAK